VLTSSFLNFVNKIYFTNMYLIIIFGYLFSPSWQSASSPCRLSVLSINSVFLID
jgi:hypothetical protein